jgi:hypothetical protein
METATTASFHVLINEPNFAVTYVALLIRKVPGSNRVPETCYPD